MLKKKVKENTYLQKNYCADVMKKSEIKSKKFLGEWKISTVGFSCITNVF